MGAYVPQNRALSFLYHNISLCNQKAVAQRNFRVAARLSELKNFDILGPVLALSWRCLGARRMRFSVKRRLQSAPFREAAPRLPR